MKLQARDLDFQLASAASPQQNPGAQFHPFCPSDRCVVALDDRLQSVMRRVTLLQRLDDQRLSQIHRERQRLQDKMSP